MNRTCGRRLHEKGINVWEGDLSMLFVGKGRAELKGEICTFSMEMNSTDKPGEKLSISGEQASTQDWIMPVEASQVLFPGQQIKTFVIRSANC